jgi:transcriptional regulator with PAS, ATPase and Fis domain
VLRESGIVVRDLASKNGTIIGGVSIMEAHLPPHGSVTVGAATIVLRVTGIPTEIPLWTAGRFGEALGGSTVMRALFAYLHQAAQTPCSVLLLGESGTGKELLAHAIHTTSLRRSGPFVVFDAGSALPELLAAELFGQVKGAFTGASADRDGVFVQADGGTLFLDEIGELPLSVQPLLLRALEQQSVLPVGSNTWRSFDVRIVAATNRDLRAEVARGGFREDLYYRLAVVTARVPPLRERKDDLELLVERFLSARREPRSILHLPANALAQLAAYDWPGNVRELRNAVERMLLLPHAPHAAQVKDDSLGTTTSFDDVFGLGWKDAREQVMNRFEEAFVSHKLVEHDGNVSKAAADMGVSRQFLHRLMERHGIKAMR